MRRCGTSSSAHRRGRGRARDGGDAAGRVGPARGRHPDARHVCPVRLEAGLGPAGCADRCRGRTAVARHPATAPDSVAAPLLASTACTSTRVAGAILRGVDLAWRRGDRHRNRRRIGLRQVHAGPRGPGPAGASRWITGGEVRFDGEIVGAPACRSHGSAARTPDRVCAAGPVPGARPVAARGAAGAAAAPGAPGV